MLRLSIPKIHTAYRARVPQRIAIFLIIRNAVTICAARPMPL